MGLVLSHHHCSLRFRLAFREDLYATDKLIFGELASKALECLRLVRSISVSLMTYITSGGMLLFAEEFRKFHYHCYMFIFTYIVIQFISTGNLLIKYFETVLISRIC